MTRRIKIATLLSPLGARGSVLRVEGYRPTSKSRFAVVRTAADRPWLLIHVRSGAIVDSAIPAVPRKLTMTDKLNVATAWEAATHLNWGPFDRIEAVILETTNVINFARADQDEARAILPDMRRLAAQAIGWNPS